VVSTYAKPRVVISKPGGVRSFNPPFFLIEITYGGDDNVRCAVRQMGTLMSVPGKGKN